MIVEKLKFMWGGVQFTDCIFSFDERRIRHLVSNLPFLMESNHE